LLSGNLRVELREFLVGVTQGALQAFEGALPSVFDEVRTLIERYAKTAPGGFTIGPPGA
jgi:hypothetical protein